jgi:hypothetical protein
MEIRYTSGETADPTVSGFGEIGIATVPQEYRAESSARVAAAHHIRYDELGDELINLDTAIAIA